MIMRIAASAGLLIGLLLLGHLLLAATAAAATSPEGHQSAQILRGLATAAVRTVLCLRQAGVNLVGLGEHHGRLAAAAVMLATGQASQLAIPSRWGALPAFRRHRRCCCFRRHS